jgi:hypothetical protein
MNLCCVCILILILIVRVYTLQKNSNPSKGIFVGEIVDKSEYIYISLAQLHRERQFSHAICISNMNTIQWEITKDNETIQRLQ